MPGTSTMRLGVQISFKDETKLLDAKLVAAHPYLDLAIVKIVGGDVSAWPALPVLLEHEGVKSKESVVIVGHKQEPKKLYVERKAEIDDSDVSGHIQVSRFVQKGTSGGPVIQDGKVLGVVVETDFREKTLVTPLWHAKDYFTIVGVAFLGEGYAKEQNTTADLIERVSSYEAVFTDILLDLDWSARLNLTGVVDPAGLKNGELGIGFDRKLRVQPMIDARLVLALGPTFAGQTERSPKGIYRTMWLEAPEAEARMESIHRDLDKLTPPNMATAEVDHIDVKMRVEPDRDRMRGHVTKFDHIPDFELCFSLIPTAQGQLKGSAMACGESHDYLNKTLAER